MAPLAPSAPVVDEPRVLLDRPGPRRSVPFLRRPLLALARHAHDRVAVADGAAVTLVLGSGPAPVGSNTYAQAVETAQLALGEGPGLAALAAGTPVRSSTIGSGEERWPHFVRRALVLSVRGVVALPLLVGDDRLGLLTLYYRDPESLEATSDADLHDAADAALQVLDDLRLRALLTESAACIDTARSDRAEVDLAVGLLIDRYALTANQALVLVVQLARQDGVSAAVAARSLTGRTTAG